MTRARQNLGTLGEELATDWLVNHCFKIVERNYRTRCGEIDIIATKARELHFIEVKTRRSAHGPAPEEQLTWFKRGQIARTAQLYLLQNPHDGASYFSVLAVDCAQNPPQLRWLPGAFTMSDL